MNFTNFVRKFLFFALFGIAAAMQMPMKTAGVAAGGSLEDIELREYQKKVEEIAKILASKKQYQFSVAISYDFDDYYTFVILYDFSRVDRCVISISAKELIRESDTEAALAWVLGHEIGHCEDDSSAIREHRETKELPEAQLAADRIAIELLLASPYAIGDRRRVLERRLNNPQDPFSDPEYVAVNTAKRLRLLKEHEHRFDDRSRVSYFLFTPEEFKRFRQLFAQRVK